MKLKFTKMQGLGNDFVVLDGIHQAIHLDRQQLRFLADRHFGIGCDQILLVEKAEGEADFRYRIFNADGGSGTMRQWRPLFRALCTRSRFD